MSDSWVVLDASVVIKAILPNPEIKDCLRVLDELSHAHWAAPVLWNYEMANAITKAVHFKQILETEGNLALKHALAMPVQLITPDVEQSLLAYSWSMKLLRASVYDCYYLALAETLGAEFWTADKKLFNALESLRLSWFHLATPGKALI